MKREYDFDADVLKQDGLEDDDLEMIQDVIEQTNQEAIKEIDKLVEENREQLDKEFNNIMSIKDPAERYKKLLEYCPWVNE